MLKAIDTATPPDPKPSFRDPHGAIAQTSRYADTRQRLDPKREARIPVEDITRLQLSPSPTPERRVRFQGKAVTAPEPSAP